MLTVKTPVALGILFLLSTFFSYIHAEPFTIAGVFLSTCYLPGLCLFAVDSRNKLLFEDLILSFPVSLGLSGLLTLGLLFFGIHISYVLVVIHIITAGAVIFCVIRKKNRSSVIEIRKQEAVFCIAAFVITLILSIPFLMGPNRGPIAAHAFHHSSLISQILNGIFPPENPGLGGTMIGYYWGFHAFIAALTAHTDFHHLQVIFTLNAISLLMLANMAFIFGRAFNIADMYCYLLPLAIIGLMRSDTGLYFLYKGLSGNLIPLESLREQYQYLLPGDVLNSWIGGIPWLDTRLFYISKMYNISAMPLAICICLAYLLLLLLFVKEQFEDKKIYQVVLGITVATSILYYPPLAIYPLLFSPLWTCIVFIFTRGIIRNKVREALKVFVPYGIGVLIVLPYILFIIASRDISSSGQGGIFRIDFYDQSIKNIVVYLIPLPVIVYGIWVACKKLSFSRELLLLLVGTLFCLGLVFFTRWPFDNSYKYNYILVFFLSVFVVYAISAVLPKLSSRWIHGLALSGISLFLLSAPFIVEAAYIASCLSMDRHLTYAKGHIIYAKDKTKNEAYAWIRDNTSPEALIMLSYTETPFPCCGINSNYEVAAIAERNLYVIKDTDYTASNPDFEERIRYREKLLENPVDPNVVKYFVSLKRSIYLLVEENLPDRFLVEERFKHLPLDFNEAFELKFDNGSQRVYLMKHSI